MTKLSRTNKRSVKKSTPLPVMSATVGAVTAVAGDVEPKEKTVTFADLNKLSYRSLQLNAKIHGLKANGTKADLIERLGG